MKHKLIYVSGYSEEEANEVISEEAESGFEPISVGCGGDCGGRGIVILFKRVQ